MRMGVGSGTFWKSENRQLAGKRFIEVGNAPHHRGRCRRTLRHFNDTANQGEACIGVKSNSENWSGFRIRRPCFYPEEPRVADSWLATAITILGKLKILTADISELVSKFDKLLRWSLDWVGREIINEGILPNWQFLTRHKVRTGCDSANATRLFPSPSEGERIKVRIL